MSDLIDVIHVGFPKTGTTWIQRVLMPCLHQVASLGKPASASVDVRFYYWFQELVSCDPLTFDASAFRDRFVALSTECQAELSACKVKFASFELLSGEIYGGQDSLVLLDRLHAIFGDVRIVVTIREQASMVESLYRHYVSSGGGLHIREFVYKTMSPCVDIWGNRLLLQRFQYDKVAELWMDRLGTDRVTLIPFELLKQDPVAFATELCLIMGITPPALADLQRRAENPSLSTLGISVLRFVNQIISTPLSDSPLLRSVPAAYGFFIQRLFRPLDKRALARLAPHSRFVDVPTKWPLRRLIKRFMANLVQHHIDPTDVSDTAFERGWDTGLLLNLVRFLDWPDKNQSIRLGSTRFLPEIDNCSIADAIRTTYAESNNRTQKLTGLPLQDLGYYT